MGISRALQRWVHPRVLPQLTPSAPLRAGERVGERGCSCFTESCYLSRRALLSPALSSLGGRRGSSSGQWPDAPAAALKTTPDSIITSGRPGAKAATGRAA